MTAGMTESIRLPSYGVRPGVTFPDWSAVTSQAARDALLGIIEVENTERRWRGYGPAEDRVRTALLQFYAERARAPDPAELAARAGLGELTVRALLASLRQRDLVVLDASGERIIGAYPFTDRDTDHRVRLGDRTLTAMCAIDALGVGAMYQRDIEINSVCRFCKAPVRVMTRDHGCEIADVDPTTTVVWAGLRYEGGCAAESLCTVLAFFCSNDHLAAWREASSPDMRGFRLSIEEALEVGRAMFAPSLAGLAATEFPETIT